LSSISQQLATVLVNRPVPLAQVIRQSAARLRLI